MTTMLVCGDCRSLLEKLGGVLDPSVKEIGLGRACELANAAIAKDAPGPYVNTHRTDRQATSPVDVSAVPESAIVRDVVVERSPSARDGGPHEELPDARASAYMPVTQLAHGLLCAWSHGDATQVNDDIAIDRAVDIVEKLLQRTGGR